MRIKLLAERLSGYWIYRKRHLPIGAELRVDLDRLGMTPRVIFDVGANVGQTYRRFRRDFPEARIHCFEPVSNAFDQLMKEMAGDQLASAQRLALGDSCGFGTIHTHAEWSELSSLRSELAVSELSEKVEIATIDSIGPPRIDLLKIDTEGFEIPVLRGAVSMLDRGSIRTVFCEVGFDWSNHRNSYIAEILDLLSPIGFRLYGLYDVTHYPQRTHASFGNALFVHHTLLC
jgi:FkbM family methyltransferase